MSWINQHQRNWRIALLILIVAAFMGPWAFDRINVPAKYPCSAPFIRFEGDFCGEPITGISLYPWVIVSFFSSTVRLISGNLVFTDWLPGFLIFIPALPVFSTLNLFRCNNNPSKQIFAIITWVLAIGVGLFWGLNNYPKLFWLSWGIWLYIGVAFSALIFEILAFIESRKRNRI